MFALNHTQYVRFIHPICHIYTQSAFLRYLKQFLNKNPQLFEWFQCDLVTMNKSDKVFPKLVIDQGHECNNELAKSV